MAIIKIYACGVNDTMSANDELPSPVSLDISNEQIWSEDTGRAQSGEHQAEMIGKSIAGKRTFAIKWGVLTPTQFSDLTSKLPRGFFKFGASTGSTVPAGLACYRSKIQYSMLQAGSGAFYKDVSVSIIEK